MVRQRLSVKRAILTVVAACALEPAFAGDDRHGDFDFEFGAWTVQLSRLVAPLSGSNEWVEYSGTSVVRPLWNGRANVGELLVTGSAGTIEGMSLRVHDPAAAQWRIHWTNARNGRVGDAMVGGFADGVGVFHNEKDFQFDGRPILVRFTFSEITALAFRLEQAYSPDGGNSWEPNWIARFEREHRGKSDGGGIGLDSDPAVTLWAMIDDAWNGRDADRFAELFDDEAIMEFVDRDETLAGREAIRMQFAKRFPTIAPAYEHRSIVTRVRADTHGVLAVDGKVDILRRPTGPELAPELFRSYRVFSLLTSGESGWRFRELRIHALQ